MTADDFRKAALELPGSVEGAHMGHPDFRVGKRVFATLGYPDDTWGMVKLTLEQQEMLVAAETNVFEPVKGAWGASGSMQVRLDALNRATVAHALEMARPTSRPERHPRCRSGRSTAEASSAKPVRTPNSDLAEHPAAR